jgi:hypothetical protein
VPLLGMPSSMGETLDIEWLSLGQRAMHLAYYDRPLWAISGGTPGLSSERDLDCPGLWYALCKLPCWGPWGQCGRHPVFVRFSIRGGPFPLRFFRAAVERSSPSLCACLRLLGYRG